MTTILKKLAIAGLAATIAVPALAQVTPPPAATEQNQPAQAGERGERAERGERGSRHEAREHRRHGPHRGAHHGQRGFSLWNAAEKLTAARTALAITPDQEEAWNDFTAAAIAFAQAGRPGPRGGEPAQPQAEAGERTLNDLRAVRMLDRMIERGNERNEAAQTLRDAVNELSGVLTPEQVQTAERLLSELRGPGRRDGQRGGPRQHHERGGERGGSSGR